MLQAALVLLGHYNGLIDGVFGKITYRALVGFERSVGRGGDGVLTAVQEDQLRQEASAVHDALGISVTTDQFTGLRLPIPAKLFTASSRSKWGPIGRMPTAVSSWKPWPYPKRKRHWRTFTTA